MHWSHLQVLTFSLCFVCLSCCLVRSGISSEDKQYLAESVFFALCDCVCLSVSCLVFSSVASTDWPLLISPLPPLLNIVCRWQQSQQASALHTVSNRRPNLSSSITGPVLSTTTIANCSQLNWLCLCAVLVCLCLQCPVTVHCTSTHSMTLHTVRPLHTHCTAHATSFITSAALQWGPV